MIRVTATAVIKNFTAMHYVAAFFVGSATVMALLAGTSDMLPFNLLMSLGVVAGGVFGVSAGSAVAEIKVTPLSYTLPGQERCMAPAVLLLGTVVSAAYAILVLLWPMYIVVVPAAQQSLSAFGFSLGVFMLVVAISVVTRDSVYVSLVVLLPLSLLLPAVTDLATFGFGTMAAPWLTINAALAARPWLSLLFAAGSVGLVFFVLGNRKLSRNSCGAPFLPLRAYDNPFKTEDYRNRMRRAAFRDVATDSRSPPPGGLIGALRRRLVGTSWDYVVTDMGVSRNPAQMDLRRLAYLLGMFVFTIYAWRLPRVAGRPLVTLFLLLAVAFVFLAPTFKARLSPMLPVGRRRHFRSFVGKGISVYGFALAALLSLKLGGAYVVGPQNRISATLASVAELPISCVLMVAGAIPLLCWARAWFRSMLGLTMFMTLCIAIVAIVGLRAYDSLARVSYSTVLLGSALCWVPFVYIAWKRCRRDDLLLP